MATKKKNGIGRIIVVLLVAAALIGGGFYAFRRFMPSGVRASVAGTAYVQTVSEWMGTDGALGMVNRFAGVIESQETWSVNQNPGSEVEEIYVAAGDEVEVGTPLFIYSIETYESTLAQSNIDLERLNAEYKTMQEGIAQLEKERKNASSNDKAAYTIQIQQQNLELKQKEYDIQSKKTEIDKLKDNIENATVYSEIAGVVQKVSPSGSQTVIYGNEDQSFIKIIKTGDLRVKGTVNEQNIWQLSEGQEMIVHSRVDPKQTWRGTLTKIDLDNAQSSQNGYYYGGDTSSQSSSYPFYVDLSDSSGLMMGQHVYIEPDLGQYNEEEKTGVWVYEYLIDQTDPSSPVVWVDEKGVLTSRKVVLGSQDPETMQIQVLEGLAMTDSIAIQDGTLKNGMATAPMSEMYANMEGDMSMMEGDMGMMEGAMMEGDMGMMEGDMGMMAEGDMGLTEGDMMAEGDMGMAEGDMMLEGDAAMPEGVIVDEADVETYEGGPLGAAPAEGGVG